MEQEIKNPEKSRKIINKYKNLKKYKIKKFNFFKSKLEQEIKNPEKSKNPKNLSFFDRFSLTPAAVPFPLEQSSILLGRIHASARLSNNKELVHFHSQLTTKY